MNRQQKDAIITDLRRMMTEAQATFIVNYKGMPVATLQGLRKNLRNEGSSLKVTKATLMRLAAKDIAGAEAFSENFKEQIGLVFVQKDVSGTAKQLVSFSKENETLKLIAGFYEAKLLTKQELDFLATLPSKEVLVAQLLGTMQAPISGLVRVLHLLIARLCYALKEIEAKQQ
jgi:large subunit ribosomal protein L10